MDDARKSTYSEKLQIIGKRIKTSSTKFTVTQGKETVEARRLPYVELFQLMTKEEIRELYFLFVK